MANSMINMLRKVGINSPIEFHTQYKQYYWEYFELQKVEINSLVLYQIVLGIVST